MVGERALEQHVFCVLQHRTARTCNLLLHCRREVWAIKLELVCAREGVSCNWTKESGLYVSWNMMYVHLTLNPDAC